MNKKKLFDITSLKTIPLLDAALLVARKKRVKKILKEFPLSSVVSEFLQHHEEHPLYSYVLQALEKYSHCKKLQLKISNAKVWDSHTENLFEAWTNSEYGKHFLDVPGSIKKKSSKSLKKMLADIIYVIKKNTSPLPVKGDYFIPDMGEISASKVMPSVLITLGNKSVTLMAKNKVELKKQELRIRYALGLLKKYHSEGYERFFLLTHTIVATQDPSIVSYSSQELPGYSTLNLTHRDDLDLLDDLLHESGHHLLNKYLELFPLIAPHFDPIFYSPWRKSLRPLRGLYHGFLTFYWAYDLFQVLSTKKSPELIKWRKKIEARKKEEHNNLLLCFPELKKATAKNLITSDGRFLLKQIMNKL
jgi:hypothetical protein